MSSKPVRRGRGRPKQVSEIPLIGAHKLDRTSLVPLYYQLAEALKQALEAGDWPPRARFPSEREIEEAFGVSRAVIRRALDLLVGDGAIIRVKGSGTFTAPPKHKVAVEGLIGTLLQRPPNLTTEVLSAGEHPVNGAPTGLLEIAGQARSLTRVTALVSISRRPAYYIDSYTSPARLPWLLPALVEEKKEVRDAALELTRIRVSIDGSYFGPWAASRLGVSPGDPVLIGTLIQLGRLTDQAEEQALEFARFLWPTDSTQLLFATELQGTRAPARRSA